MSINILEQLFIIELTMTSIVYFHFPHGTLLIKAKDKKIFCISCADTNRISQQNATDSINEKIIFQLDAYMKGALREFDIPLALSGTPFQKKVWQHLMTIPFGKTQSYAEVADAIGHPKAARAVGSACGKNPCLLVIPCHRVIGSNAGLGGFAAGIPMKKALLSHEQRVLQSRERVA